MNFKQFFRKIFLSISFLSAIILFFAFQANTASALIPSGSKDYSFNTGEESSLDNEVFATAIQSDGKVVIGGSFTSFSGTGRDFVARLNIDGSLDTTFNSSGVGADNEVKALAIQDDGKIVIGGWFTSYNGIESNHIARLNTDGSLDTTFNNLNAGANNCVGAIAIQQDGKIIISGDFNNYNGIETYYIARLNADGSLDATFNDLGTGSNNGIYTVLIQGDGKILIGGIFSTYNGIERNEIARLNADGTLDTTFNVGTGTNNEVTSMAIQQDNKVIIGGYFSAYNETETNKIARLNTDGSLDNTFDVGTGANDNIKTIIIQQDNKIIIGGSFSTYNDIARNSIARLYSDGSLDNTFNVGTGTDSWINKATIQNDGKVIISGTFRTYNGVGKDRIARLNSDGSLDTTFNVGTGFNEFVNTIAIQQDGKVIIGGAFTTYNGVSKNAIARLNSDGSLDTTFNIGTGADSFINTIAIQQDGKVIIGGFFTAYNGTSINRIARLNSDGSLDNTFNIGSGFNDSIYTIAIQQDGKIIAGGAFTSYNGTGINRIARLDSDGSLDGTFNVGTGANNEVSTIAIQQDGKVLIGGAFISYNGTGINRIARLNSNGSLDNTFNVGIGANQRIYTIAIQQDNEVLIGGMFTSYNNTGINRIVRLNTDGSLDTSFNVGTGTDYTISKIAIQQDNKILIGGLFNTYNGTSRSGIARLNSNGSLDNTFNDLGSGANNGVNIITIREDAEIIIGGYFTSYNDSPSPRLVRILSEDLHQVEHPNSDLNFVETSTGMAPEVNTDYGINSNEVSIIMKNLGLPVALMSLDFSLSDLNLTGISSDNDTTTGKAFFHFDDAATTNSCSPNCSFSDVPGAVGETYSLYIPKLAGHDSVKICPNADSLDDINLSCASGYTLKQGDENLSVVTVDGQEYWVVAGLTGTGGMSILFADTLSRTGDNMFYGIAVVISVLVSSMLLPKLYKIYKGRFLQ